MFELFLRKPLPHGRGSEWSRVSVRSFHHSEVGRKMDPSIDKRPGTGSRRPIILHVPLRVAMSFVVTSFLMDSAGAQEAADASPGRPVVEGQVYNHHGQGIAEVDVALHAAGAAEGSAPMAVTRTDRYGDFKLVSDTPLSGAYVVTFKKNGYDDVSREVVIKADGIPPFVDLVMPGARLLVGIVVARESGIPVAGANLVATTGGRYLNKTSDDDGRFKFDGLHPGPGNVTTEADGYARRGDPFPPANAGGVMRIELDPERIVRFTTVDADGEPVAGAEIVCMQRLNWEHHWRVTTDKNGSGVVRGLSRDVTEAGLRVTHPGYVSDEAFHCQRIRTNPTTASR